MLPQHEVEGITLELVDFDARSGAQIGEALAREFSVALELRHGVHHVAVRGRIRVALLDKRGDHRNDVRQILRGPRLDIRSRDAQ